MPTEVLTQALKNKYVFDYYNLKNKLSYLKKKKVQNYLYIMSFIG